MRVLYVEGTPASARYLSGALSGAGLRRRGCVRRRRCRRTAAGFDPYDVVILSDVARDGDSRRAPWRRCRRWVEHGGGLLVAGGEAVFGEGEHGAEAGYRHTPIERRDAR